MTLPTRYKPFAFDVFVEKHPYTIPALKNNPQLGITKKGKPYTRKDEALQAFLTYNRYRVEEDYVKEGFQTIDDSNQVLLWGFVQVFVHNSDDNPAVDVDNQLQSIQELQMPNIICDDRIVDAIYIQRIMTNVQRAQYGRLWVWVEKRTPLYFEVMMDFYAQHRDAIVPRLLGEFEKPEVHPSVLKILGKFVK